MVSLPARLFAAIFLLSAVSAQCSKQLAPYTCKRHGPTIFYMDISNSIGTRTDANMELDYMTNNYLPIFDFQGGNKAAVIGEGFMNNPLTSDYSTACFQTQALQDYVNNGSALRPQPLLDMITQYHDNYADVMKDNWIVFMLFSRSNDADDIKATSQYIRTNLMDMDFITVVLYNAADANPAWNDFPAKAHFFSEIPDLPNDTFTDCLMLKDCYDYASMCDSLATGVPPTTTKAPTTMAATSTTAAPTTGLDTSVAQTKTTAQPIASTIYVDTTTMAYTTATVPPTTTPTKAPAPPTTNDPGYGKDVNGPACQCNPSTSWNDVMLLVDMSSGMGLNGLMEVLATASGQLDFFNVRKASEGNVNNSTRLGVITYASNATVANPLGSLGQEDIDDIPFNFESTFDKYTNLNNAINLAINEFNGPNGRKNSRKVILLMASVYSDAGFEDPVQASNQFQETMNGVIISYDYVQEFGIPSPKLVEVTTPGYFLINLNATNGDEIINALCDANCFCTKATQSFQQSSERNVPLAGCYSPVTTITNYNLASKICTASYNGRVATSRTPEKAQFLDQLMAAKAPQWLGLQYDPVSTSWKWSDGQTLSSSYAPWANGSPNPASDGQCSVQFNNATILWKPVQCATSNEYICEASPCDSTHYCDQS